MYYEIKVFLVVIYLKGFAKRLNKRINGKNKRDRACFLRVLWKREKCLPSPFRFQALFALFVTMTLSVV